MQPPLESTAELEYMITNMMHNNRIQSENRLHHAGCIPHG